MALAAASQSDTQRAEPPLPGERGSSIPLRPRPRPHPASPPLRLADGLTPTSLADCTSPAHPAQFPPHALDDAAGNIDQTEWCSGEIGAPRGTQHLFLADQAATAARAWGPHGEDKDVNHAHPRPIPVSPPTSAMGFDQTLTDTVVGTYREPLSLDDYMKNRRPSISFCSKVTLETGHQRPLDEPLPKLVIDTTSRRKSLSQEAQYPTRSPFSRAQSDTDCRRYASVTGQPLDITPRLNPAPRSIHDQRPAPITLSDHPTIPEATEPRTSCELEQGDSLTSEFTASPLVSEVQTPIDNMELLLSPISTFSSLTFPISLDTSSAWPKPRRQTTGPRTKSYEAERGFGMRSIQRQNSRTSSRRSTSSSMSPATAFLSRFSRQEAPPEPDSEGQEVGEYVLGKQVGFGGFSTVREAYTIEGDERICRAVKVVRRQIPGKAELENDQLQAEFEHEVSLWRCLGHRNILPLIEVYETNFATFCFTKLNTGGTLFDVVRANRQGINRDLARRYAYQLASAIRYLHEDVRVVHRDIKLENCLVDVSDPDAAKHGGNVLLCDFGLAEFVTHDLVRQDSFDSRHGMADHSPIMLPTSPTLSENATSVAGSLQYASPELVMSPAGFLSTVVDVWAYGVVMYALLVGDLPFQHSFQPRVQMKILAGEWNVPALEQAPGVAGYEDEALEMMRGCLDMESERRWTISQVLGSQWLSGCQEILEELNADFKL